MRNTSKHRFSKKNRPLLRQCSVYEPDFKKTVVQFAEQRSTSEARKRYGISESNIRRWRKLKANIDNAIKMTRSNMTTCDDIQDPSNSLDSMPLEQRLRSRSNEHEEILQSQPLSPTKLKVTRQSTRPRLTVLKTQVPVPPSEDVCVRWNSHHSNIQDMFPSLLLKEQYVDATLVAEGQCIKCHKVILSSCSPYFENVLGSISPCQHPVIFMKDVSFWILQSICNFIYAGEVNVPQARLEEFLAAANMLKIKGLAQTADNIKREIKNESNIEEDVINELKEKSRDIRDRLRETTERQRVDRERFKDVIEKSRDLKDEVRDKRKQITSLSAQRSAKFYNRRTRKLEKRNVDHKADKLTRDVKPAVNKVNIFNPMDLLKPVYEEIADENNDVNACNKRKETRNVPVKKPVLKKIRKRKILDDRDESPPPVLSSQGTRSRPNRKIQKFYYPPYEQKVKLVEPIESTIVREPRTDQTDPLLEIDQIKSEPFDVDESVIEIEDNIIDFNDQDITVCEEELIRNDGETIKQQKILDPGAEKSCTFKKINLSSQPITDTDIIEGGTSNNVKIVDVSDIKNSNENAVFSDDPLNFNQNNSNITITHIETVVENEDSMSFNDLGFQISKVTSGIDEGNKLDCSNEKEEEFKKTFNDMREFLNEKGLNEITLEAGNINVSQANSEENVPTIDPGTEEEQINNQEQASDHDNNELLENNIENNKIADETAALPTISSVITESSEAVDTMNQKEVSDISTKNTLDQNNLIENPVSSNSEEFDFSRYVNLNESESLQINHNER